MEEKLYLGDIIEMFKKERTQEKYNEVLKRIFLNLDKCLLVPTKLEDGGDELLGTLKDLHDEMGNSYVVAYSVDYKEIDNFGEALTLLKIKKILEIVANNEKSCGIILNPDKEIDDNNKFNQCVITKEAIIKVIKMCNE